MGAPIKRSTLKEICTAELEKSKKFNVHFQMKEEQKQKEAAVGVEKGHGDGDGDGDGACPSTSTNNLEDSGRKYEYLLSLSCESSPRRAVLTKKKDRPPFKRQDTPYVLIKPKMYGSTLTPCSPIIERSSSF